MSNKFRVQLLELAKSLSKEDVESIVFLYLTSPDMEEQSALKILLKLEMLGHIDPANPSTLENVFKEIKRMDLAKKVKDFNKRSRRPAKKTAEGLDVNLQANFEVAVLQGKLFIDQLTKVAEQAGSQHVEKGISQVREVVAEQVDKLQELKNDSSGLLDSIGSGEINLVSSRRNSFDKELSQSVQRRSARDPDSPTKVSGRPPVPPKRGSIKKPVQEAIPEAETEYAEVGPSQLCALKGTDIGRFARSTAPNARQPQEDSSSGDTLVTGALGKMVPAGKKKPLIPPRQQKTQKPKEFNVQVREGEDDSTAGTTGDTTGDSGFADATPFMKVTLGTRLRQPDEDTLPSLQDSLSSTDETLASEPDPGYYKSLQREQVAPVSYYKQARGDCQRYQDLMEDHSDPPRMKDAKPQKSTKSRPASSHNTF